LWPGRIPAGRITLLVGRPGGGKSFITIDAAARVTTGRPWPDNQPCPQGSVILISAEDDPADTIRPRLDAHDADCERVHLLSAVRCADRDRNGPMERMITLADLGAIEEALKRHADCKLLVVDPIGSFLGGQTDAHRDNEVRSVLAPIAKLAEQYGLAVLVVAHRRKSSANTADDLALGSRAFTGIARAVWHLSQDPRNKARRLFLPGKNNLAPEGHGLAMSIIGQPGEVGRVCWEREPVRLNADEALAVENSDGGNKHGPKPERRTQAAAWLRERLARGPVEVATVTAEAKAAGYALRTLHRAKDELDIVSYRERFGGPSLWAMPTVPSDSQRENNLASWHDSEKTEENADSEPGTIAGCQVDLSWHDRRAEGANGHDPDTLNALFDAAAGTDSEGGEL
jgi:hypothetical protein